MALQPIRNFGQAFDLLLTYKPFHGQTAPAFNKAFKRALHLSPTEFRKLGKDDQLRLAYDLEKPRTPKEANMKLSETFETVHRPSLTYLFLEKQGPFPEAAPRAWDEMLPLMFKEVKHHQIVEFLGLSKIDSNKLGEEAMIYQAGVGLAKALPKLPKGIKQKAIAGGNFAKFTLTGPYPHIWPAFQLVFQQLNKENIKLRNEFCIEIYRNDPKDTPEKNLITELLVPVG